MKCHLAVLAHVVSPSVLAREHTPPPFAQRETLRIPRCIFFTVILLMRETVSRDQLWSRTSHTKSPSNYTERPLFTPHDPENPMTRSVGLQRSARSGSESLLLSELLIYQKKKLRIKWTHDPFWTCRSSQTLNMFVSFVYPLCLFSTKWSLKLNRKQLCRQQCQHAHLCFGFSACRSQGSCFVQLCFPLQTVIFCVVWTRHRPCQRDNYQKHVTNARTDWQEKCRCLLPCLFSNCTDMKDLCSDPWAQKYPETDVLNALFILQVFNL